MEVTQAPLPDVSTARPDTAAAARAGPPSPAPVPPSPPADRLDIQPLDPAAALQILIAEVRAELQLPADVSRAQTTAQTAQLVLQLLFEALPAEPGTPAGAALPAAVANGDAAAVAAIALDVLSALDRAVATVAAWRDVPHGVVDSVREARELIATAVNDERPSPLWARPEWEWFLPRIRRYWRRRRPGRRELGHVGLSDPDFTRREDGGDGCKDPPSVPCGKD